MTGFEQIVIINISDVERRITRKYSDSKKMTKREIDKMIKKNLKEAIRYPRDYDLVNDIWNFPESEEEYAKLSKKTFKNQEFLKIESKEEFEEYSRKISEKIVKKLIKRSASKFSYEQIAKLLELLEANKKSEEIKVCYKKAKANNVKKVIAIWDILNDQDVMYDSFEKIIEKIGNSEKVFEEGE